MLKRAKGIIAKPMPECWYSVRECVEDENDDEATKKLKQFNRRIVADRKPYFMTYVYPTLKKEYKTYIQNCDRQTQIMFQINSLEELYEFEPKTDGMKEFIRYYRRLMPVGNNACVVNRISALFEKNFKSYSYYKLGQPEFDYTILKSDVSYSKSIYNEILRIYKEYLIRMDDIQAKNRKERMDKDYGWTERQRFVEEFRRECFEVCTNENELCDIILDICYKTEGKKQFAWDVVGDVMIENLLRKNNYTIHFPIQVESDGDFEYCGAEFKLCEKRIDNRRIEEVDETNNIE